MGKLEYRLKAEPGEKGKEILDMFKEKFSSLLDKTEGNLNQYVKSDKVEIQDPEVTELLWGVLSCVVDVDAYIDWDKFFGQFDIWENREKMDRFLLWMQEYVDDRTEAYRETAFIREMDKEVLSQTLRYYLKTRILNYGDMQMPEMALEADKEKVLVKVLRTLISMTLNGEFDYTGVCLDACETFAWSEEIFRIFWRVINERRPDLYSIIIIHKLKSLEKEIEKLKSEIRKE